MSRGSPDWLTPTVPVIVTIEPGEPPDITVEDSPIAQTWGWDPTGDGQWRKILVNSDGKLIIDPSEIFEDIPTNNEHGKAPTSNWAYKHRGKANIHHAPPEASDFEHDDLSGRTANNHHTKTVLHSEITDFHEAVQNTPGVRGGMVEKAPQLDTNTAIYEIIVFESQLYGIAYPDGALFEWNGSDEWVKKASKVDAENGGYCLCSHNSKLYMGSLNHANLYEWNGTNSWIIKADGIGTAITIYCLASFNGKLYAGVNDDGALWEWDGVDTWILKASKYGSENDIRKLLVFNNKLYGGTNPNGVLLEWNESDAWILRSQSSGIDADIESMCIHNNKLYVGSDISAQLWEWDDTDLLLLKAPQFMGRTYIDSLISFDGILYGGSYTSAVLLAWNGVDAWALAFSGDGVETSIRSLCEFNDNLYGSTQEHAKLFQFERNTLYEFQLGISAHHVKTYKASEITEGIFNRERLAGPTEGLIFYDRGDPQIEDFFLANFGVSGSWTDLDLSSIVPAGAVAVLVRIEGKATNSGKYFQVRAKGQISSKNIIILRTQAANVSLDHGGLVMCDSNRKIQYYKGDDTFTTLRLTVRGWWK